MPLERITLVFTLAAGGILACDPGDSSDLGRVASGTGGAFDDAALPPGAQPPRIPEEAFIACENLDSGAQCSVTLPSRNLEGTCRPGPEGQGPLACAPSAALHPGGPCVGPPPGPPPVEAVTACQELASGAQCSVTLPSRNLEGTCRPGPEGQGPLACAPSAALHLGGPCVGPPPGPPPVEAVTACQELDSGASCGVTLPARTLEGICREGPKGLGPLACAPARPAPPAPEAPPSQP